MNKAWFEALIGATAILSGIFLYDFIKQTFKAQPTLTGEVIAVFLLWGSLVLILGLARDLYEPKD